MTGLAKIQKKTKGHGPRAKVEWICLFIMAFVQLLACSNRKNLNHTSSLSKLIQHPLSFFCLLKCTYVCTYNLLIIQKILIWSDSEGNAETRVVCSRISTYPPITGGVSICALRYSGALVLYHTPSTQRVPIRYTTKTIPVHRTLLQRYPHNLNSNKNRYVKNCSKQ